MVTGAAVTVNLTGPNESTVGIYNGNTDTSGVYRTGFASNLTDGTYVADVTSLSYSTFVWAQALDTILEQMHTIRALVKSCGNSLPG